MHCVFSFNCPTECHLSSLLTVGQTVDEAAFLFFSLDQACHSQLMADAAAANGVPKKIISDEVAQYTADAVQNPVSDWTQDRFPL